MYESDSLGCTAFLYRTDLAYMCPPAQANFLTCARTATKAFPGTTAPRHSNQAGLCLRLGLGFRIGVVAAVSRGRKQSHRRGGKIPDSQARGKTLYTSLHQHHFMRAHLKEVRSPAWADLGQLYASCIIYFEYTRGVYSWYRSK